MICLPIRARVSAVACGLFAVAIVMAGTNVHSQTDLSLYPIIQGDKYGYIDQSGRVVISPRFENAKRFSEGLARVKVNGKWGFIDSSGAIVIEPRFEIYPYGGDGDNAAYLDFHEGLAGVSLAEGRKWGYINRRGEVVVPLTYDHVSPFSEGLAVVSFDYSETRGNSTNIYIGGRAHYIDKTGKSAALKVVGTTFSEGLAVAHVKKGENNYAGYIDKSGRFVIAPRSWVAEPFRDGVARVRVYNLDRWGYIDGRGRVIVPMKLKNAGDFFEGLARVGDFEEMGFVDRAGVWVIPPRYLFAGNFYEGLAAACVRDEKNPLGMTCGFIDKRGSWAVRPRFLFMLGDFHRGLAMAWEKDRWGYIDRTGKFVWSQEHQADGSALPGTSMTGCSLLSDKRHQNYPCQLEIKLF